MPLNANDDDDDFQRIFFVVNTGLGENLGGFVRFSTPGDLTSPDHERRDLWEGEPPRPHQSVRFRENFSSINTRFGENFEGLVRFSTPDDLTSPVFFAEPPGAGARPRSGEGRPLGRPPARPPAGEATSPAGFRC